MLLFFSGWPACGESYYGEWLASRYDFIHLDLEGDHGREPELREQCEKLTPARAPAFAARLRKQHPRWVITRPATGELLPRLEALRAADFSLWFFLPRADGLSRQRWLMHERERDPEVRPLAWERQAAAIRSHAREMRPYFRDHCVQTLDTAGELLDGDALAARVGVVPVRS